MHKREFRGDSLFILDSLIDELKQDDINRDSVTGITEHELNDAINELTIQHQSRY